LSNNEGLTLQTVLLVCRAHFKNLKPDACLQICEP
jgi:hypothetical protein